MPGVKAREKRASGRKEKPENPPRLQIHSSEQIEPHHREVFAIPICTMTTLAECAQGTHSFGAVIHQLPWCCTGNSSCKANPSALPFGACGLQGAQPLKATHNTVNALTQQPSLGKSHSEEQCNQHKAWLSGKINTSTCKKNKSFCSFYQLGHHLLFDQCLFLGISHNS